MRKLLLLTFILSQFVAAAQPLRTPAEIKNFSEPSSYEEIVKYLNQLDQSSDLLAVESIGRL